MRCLLSFALLFAVAPAQLALADAVSDARTRCALRVGIALTGKSPSATLLTATDPQSEIDALMVTPEFIDRYSRFINAQFNAEPGGAPREDAAYHLAKKILTDNLPWRDLFVGPYKVDKANANNASVAVFDDPSGLGYFRSFPWRARYAGNEEAGYRLIGAYRILQNTIGVEMIAATNAPGADLTAVGRQAAGCRGCHYDGPFALDLVARVLSRRQGFGNQIMFTAPTDGPQVLFGGTVIADDRELVTTLVDSESFRFNTCRLAFKFLYGREENVCEGPLFDSCMQSFTATGMVQDAVRAIAKDPGFCR